MRDTKTRILLILIPFLILRAPRARAVDEFHPSLTIRPDASFILLDGDDSTGLKHVLRSQPSFGVEGEVAFRGMLGALNPKVAVSSRVIRFSGSNQETIQYSSDVYSGISGGLEAVVTDGLVLSGLAGLEQEIFLRVPSSSVIIVDRVNTPVATFQADVGVYKYKSFLFDVHAKVLGYFPVHTQDYSAKFGYGLQPWVSTTHEFSNHVSGTGEFYYLKRMQNSTAYDLTEQDFGVALSVQFTD